MLQANTVAGKTVLTRDGGEKVASVIDLVTAPDHSRVIALIVDGGGLFSSIKVVPLEQVVSISNDVVIITDKDAIIAADEHPAVKESLASKVKLIGKNVYTETGIGQGTVKDVSFDEDTGEIAGYELTEVSLNSVTYGVAFLTVQDMVSIGPDAMIVRAEAIARVVREASGANNTVK